VAKVWTRILERAPGSILKLRALQFQYPAAIDAMRALFTEAGLDPARILFSSWQATIAEGLADYGTIDLALDPFPYNGTTTTCEALWMGVPVVALAGAAHAGRVGASLLSSLGVETELVASSPDDYVAKAAALAADRGRLQHHRTTLRALMAASPLTDATRFAGEFEQSLRAAWRDAVADRPS
jgi:predicted O-linked N-acetylglucosamine transferase (SPINDLY family)